MSSLFAGPRSITSWIEQAVYQALLRKNVETRTKLVQVVSLGAVVLSTDLVPHYLRVSDGQTTILVVLSEESPQKLLEGLLPTRGCVVRISDWHVSAINLLDKESNVDPNKLGPEIPRQWDTLCLYTKGSVETLGGHGMGIVGDPVDVNASVDVRRAFQSFDYNLAILYQRLGLQHRQHYPEECKESLDENREKAKQSVSSVLHHSSGADLPIGNGPALFASQRLPSADLPLGNVFQLFASQQQQSDLAAFCAAGKENRQSNVVTGFQVYPLRNGTGLYRHGSWPDANSLCQCHCCRKTTEAK